MTTKKNKQLHFSFVRKSKMQNNCNMSYITIYADVAQIIINQF